MHTQISHTVALSSKHRLYNPQQTDTDKDDSYCTKTGVMYVCTVDGCIVLSAECGSIHSFCGEHLESASTIRSGLFFLQEVLAFGCQFSSSSTPPPSAPVLDEGE